MWHSNSHNWKIACVNHFLHFGHCAFLHILRSSCWWLFAVSLFSCKQQCFSPSLQILVSSNGLSPSPIPSPTRRFRWPPSLSVVTAVNNIRVTVLYSCCKCLSYHIHHFRYIWVNANISYMINLDDFFSLKWLVIAICQNILVWRYVFCAFQPTKSKPNQLH